MNEIIKMIKLTLNVQLSVNDLGNFLQTGDPLISLRASDIVESIIPIAADRNASCSTIVQHAQPLLTSTVNSNEPITVQISNYKSNSAAGVPWLHKNPTKKKKIKNSNFVKGTTSVLGAVRATTVSQIATALPKDSNISKIPIRYVASQFLRKSDPSPLKNKKY